MAESWEAFLHDLNDDPPELDPTISLDEVLATAGLDETLAIAGNRHPSLAPFLEGDALAKRSRSENSVDHRALLDKLFAHADVSDHGFIEMLRRVQADYGDE